MSSSVISVQNVSKRYCRRLKQSMLYAMTDIARDVMGMPSNRSNLRKDEFWSLKNVSFEVQPGACLGLIGGNGAGKSTLLKLLNGILRPDAGMIRVTGRVGALIEVGAGFHPMLSGRENIYVNGAILGMSKREIDRKYDAIVDFAELSPDVLESPVKTYSSGMYVRLGFAVAIHCEPDVMLIDEVLAVGDAKFVGKCHQRIQQLLNAGVSCVLVSHSLNMIESFCSQAVLLNLGQVLEAGPVKVATTRYRQMVMDTPAIPEKASKMLEHSGIAITGIEVRDGDNHSVKSLPSGVYGTIEVKIRSTKPVDKGILTLSMQRHPDGLVPLSCQLQLGTDLPYLETGVYRFTLPFLPTVGNYKAWATITGESKLDILDQIASAMFEIIPSEHASERVLGETTQGACILPPTSIDIYGPDNALLKSAATLTAV